MSKFQDGIQYYLLVAGVGLLAASIAIGFYLLYQEIWMLTEQALAYSIIIIVPLSFLAIGLPFLLVKRFAKTKNTGSGTHTVLEAYHLSNGEVSIEDTIVKPIAGMLTIGLGGSAGPEGPSLLVGGGVASAISRRFKIKADLRRILFVAGAAAGLAATFRTPLTAILFALEIPYKNDLDRETFIEAVVASVPAYLLAVAVLGSEPFFGAVGDVTITLNEIGLSLALGLICGLYAVFFTKTFSWMEHLSLRLRKKIGNAGLVCIAAALLSFSGFDFSLHYRDWIKLYQRPHSGCKLEHFCSDSDHPIEDLHHGDNVKLRRKRRTVLSDHSYRRGHRLHLRSILQRKLYNHVHCRRHGGAAGRNT